MADIRSVPEPGSPGGGPRDPWAGFPAGSGPGPRPPNGDAGRGDPSDADRDVVDLARRLLGRLDGQDALLERAADRPDDRARVGELRDGVRRIRRDGEALLLLSGADVGAHGGPPQAVPAVLGEALALVDEPSRAALRPLPSVSVVARAAVELRHLVAQLVDEAAAAAPGARVEVGGRLDPGGALVVEVVVAGRGWSDGLGAARRTAFGAPRLAERLARRSTGGIRIERPLIDAVEGLVATVHCPAVLVVGGAADPWARSSSRGPGSRPDPLAAGPLPASPLSPSPLSPSPLSRGPLPSRSPSPLGALVDAPETSLLLATGSARQGSGDELFGPLPASAVDTASTPIFEAVASAWFRDDERGPAAEEWSSPGDREWRAAAAAATRAEVSTTMASGLPRRSPGDRLVPPPRTSRQSVPDERVPERVRDRLATYQRGLREGRHRAVEPGAADAAAPEAWTADGW